MKVVIKKEWCRTQVLQPTKQDIVEAVLAYNKINANELVRAEWTPDGELTVVTESRYPDRQRG